MNEWCTRPLHNGACYSVLKGRYFKVFVERDEKSGDFVWYLSDHENAADSRPLPSAPPCPGCGRPRPACDAEHPCSTWLFPACLERRVNPTRPYRLIDGDIGHEPTIIAALARGRAVLAELERRQTLAWISCQPTASRWWWPRSMFPGLHEREMIGQPGCAAIWAWHTARSLRLSFQYLPERT